MASSIVNRAQTMPDDSLVIGRPKMAKASMDDNHGQERLSDVVKEAARRSFGKEGAAARQLGKDEGNFSRDVKHERLTMRDLSALGAPFLAELGKELVDQFGQLSDPKDRARALVHQIESCLLELKQFIEAA